MQYSFISKSNQEVINAVIRFFESKLHSVRQIGYGLMVSLDPTYEGPESDLKEGVHLYTLFYLCTHTSAEHEIQLGELYVVTTHTHPKIVEMLRELKNSCSCNLTNFNCAECIRKNQND